METIVKQTIVSIFKSLPILFYSFGGYVRLQPCSQPCPHPSIASLATGPRLLKRMVRSCLFQIFAGMLFSFRDPFDTSVFSVERAMFSYKS